LNDIDLSPQVFNALAPVALKLVENEGGVNENFTLAGFAFRRRRSRCARETLIVRRRCSGAT
jgi:hypothetical protein